MTPPSPRRTVEVRDQKVGEVDDDLRRARQGGTEVREHFLEDRSDLEQQQCRHTERDQQDDRRVHHRALDLATQLLGLLFVDGEAVEDRVENTADLTCGAQLHVELVEHLRMILQRVRERRARLNATLHREDALLHRRAVGLGCENVQALHERKAGVDHRRELAGEDEQVSLSDAVEPGDVEIRVEDRLLANLAGSEPETLETGVDARGVVGLHLALLGVTLLGLGFPEPQRDLLLRPCDPRRSGLGRCRLSCCTGGTGGRHDL